MKNKVFFLFIIAVAYSVSINAQSSDAAYPEGTWINETPGIDSKPYGIYIVVKRVTEPDKEHNGVMNCGYIEVTTPQKTIYEGSLTYAGKGLDKDVSNGIYYFTVKTPSGQKNELGLKKTAEEDLYLVSLTGPMSNHPFLKETCYLGPLNGSWTPATIEVFTEAELLEGLKAALNDSDKERIEYRTRGYGNVRQYIQAHQGLNPKLPKYATPKGTTSINIRRKGENTAEKIGEMQPNTTLLVVDEYNGWCQVKMGEKQFGWVSLSVVKLTNKAGKATVAQEDDDNIYAVVEQQPQFPGGQDALMAYLSNNIKYPSLAQDTNKQGRVLVSFVVNTDGTIVEPTVVKGVERSLDKEALRVVKAMPKWIPGKEKGKPVRVKYTIPVLFKLK